MAHDPVHLFIGLYDSGAAAERDFQNVVHLHREGLVAAYDAALLERGEDGALRVAHKKRSGHHVLTGFGVGALLTVLTPFVAIPFGLIGAGTGALMRHAEGSLPRKDAEELGAALEEAAGAVVVVSNKTGVDRAAQMLPEAKQRVAKVLDVDEHEFAAALQQAAEEQGGS
ncbi:MAG TPA: hypothetical protein VMH50_11500 [Thermoleophilia bacterium]|nr:hypothetical protein [Thermoleophilia bacterium]